MKLTILFDFNGVLVSRKSDPNYTLAKILQVPIRKLHLFHRDRTFKGELGELWQQIHNLETENVYLTAFAKSLIQHCQKQETPDLINKIINAKKIDNFRLKPNLISNLELLSKAFNLVILTNGRPSRRYILSQLGLTRFFPQAKVYISGEIGFGKSHPQSFEYVCQQEEITPQQIIFCDDSLQFLSGAIKLNFKQLVYFQANRKKAKKINGPLTKQDNFKVVSSLAELIKLPLIAQELRIASNQSPTSATAGK